MGDPYWTCPGCDARMETQEIRGMTIGHCADRDCRGIWFEFRKLEEFCDRRVEVELLGGHTERKCATCRETMEPALLPGAIPVEICLKCHALFLDEGELQELSGSRAALRIEQLQRSRGPSLHGFVCAKCERRFPLREANVTASGMTCTGCTPQPQTTLAEKRDANFDVLDGRRRHRRHLGMVSLLELLW